MDREQAWIELRARVRNSNLVKHSLAVEAIMRKLASRLKGDAETWGIVGLLHDIDYERTVNEPEKHGLVGAEILENIGFDEEVIYAVRAHNPCHGIERKRKMDKTLYCADPVSGPITACAWYSRQRSWTSRPRPYLGRWTRNHLREVRTGPDQVLQRTWPDAGRIHRNRAHGDEGNIGSAGL